MVSDVGACVRESLSGISGEGDKMWRVICVFLSDLPGASCEADDSCAMFGSDNTAHCWAISLPTSPHLIGEEHVRKEERAAKMCNLAIQCRASSLYLA